MTLDARVRFPSVTPKCFYSPLAQLVELDTVTCRMTLVRTQEGEPNFWKSAREAKASSLLRSESETAQGFKSLLFRHYFMCVCPIG